MNQSLKKWKTCEIIIVGLNATSRGYVESLYHEGLLGVAKI